MISVHQVHHTLQIRLRDTSLIWQLYSHWGAKNICFSLIIFLIHQIFWSHEGASLPPWLTQPFYSYITDNMKHHEVLRLDGFFSSAIDISKYDTKRFGKEGVFDGLRRSIALNSPSPHLYHLGIQGCQAQST